MTTQTPSSDSGQTQALADFAFGSHTQVIDVSRPLAWLSPEEMGIDQADPQQKLDALVPAARAMAQR